MKEKLLKYYAVYAPGWSCRFLTVAYAKREAVEQIHAQLAGVLGENAPARWLMTAGVVDIDESRSELGRLS